MAHAMPPGLAIGPQNHHAYRVMLMRAQAVEAHLGPRHDGGHRINQLRLEANAIGITPFQTAQAVQTYIAHANAVANLPAVAPPPQTGDRTAKANNDMVWYKERVHRGEVRWKMITFDQPTVEKTFPMPNLSTGAPMMNNVCAAIATGSSCIPEMALISADFSPSLDALGAISHGCPGYHATMPTYNIRVQGNNQVTVTTIPIVKHLLRRYYGNNNDQLINLGDPTTWHTNADVAQFWTGVQNLATIPSLPLRETPIYASAFPNQYRVPPVADLRNTMHTDRFQHHIVEGFQRTSFVPAESYLDDLLGAHTIMPGNMLPPQIISNKPHLHDKQVNNGRVHPREWDTFGGTAAQRAAGLEDQITDITDARAADYQRSDAIEESQHAYVNMDMFNAMHGHLMKQDRDYYTNRTAMDFNQGFVMHQVDSEVVWNSGARTGEWMNQPAHFGLARLIMPVQTKMAFHHINGPSSNPFTCGKMLKFWDYHRPMHYPELWWPEFVNVPQPDSSSDSDSN